MMKPEASSHGGGSRKTPRTAVGTAEQSKPKPSMAEIVGAVKEMSRSEILELKQLLIKELRLKK